MGRADSPLRDRVVFVTGSPRSGTTWLAQLLLAHPGLAGVANESHLFDQGVNALFDNHERTGQGERFLVEYLDRPALADLARDLCDGVLLQARARTRPEAPFVLEKTPMGRPRPEVEVRRKAEVYPDARYVHLIRDGRAVVRSLLHVPWRPESPAAAARIWREAVVAVREGFGTLAYTEVRYEDLREDPLAACGRLLGWLGLDPAEADGDFVRRVARVKFGSREPDRSIVDDRWRDELGPAELAAVDAEAGELLRELGYGRGARGATGETRTESAPGAPAGASVPDDPRTVAEAFARALRERDAARLASLLAPEVVVELRTGSGDLSAAGPGAVEALADIGRAVFGRRLATESWVTTVDGDRVSILMSGNAPDARRVDVAMVLEIRAGAVSAAVILVAGPPEGKPVTRWTGPAG